MENKTSTGAPVVGAPAGNGDSPKGKAGSSGLDRKNPKKGIGGRLWRNRYLYLMLLPAVVYVVIFSYIPMGGIILAFKNLNYVKGFLGSPWVGMQNFKFLFMSNKLWFLTRNTILYNLAFIAVGMFLEVGFAIIISELGRKMFKKVFQSLMFLPYFISWVVVTAIVQALFSYEFGLVNNILAAIGLNRVNIYASAGIWPYLLVMFRAWKNTGYGSVVYLATVTGIDQQMYDAASIDGASIWQRIRYITIPCLVPTMVIMFMLALGQVFRGDFGLFYQLVKDNAMILPTTDILDLFIYRALSATSNIGQASAAGFYQSVLCFITISTVNFIIRKTQPDYALY
ncbi:MAG: ABC transporter permease subunit [Lachnospiraceae bacterium]|jgi:putative aldouronate transport system permease protein|nr:ABC transporter permease subunit [Lachnospiraceae bacterium]